MQDNFSSYTTKIKKIGKIARFQALCDALNQIHQIDFENRNGVLWVVMNENSAHEMQEIKADRDTSMTVTFSTTYPSNLIVDTCNCVGSRRFCTQKTFAVEKGYWKIAKVKLNKKINFQ